MQILFLLSPLLLLLSKSWKSKKKKKTPKTLQSFRGLKSSMCLKDGRERNQKPLKVSHKLCRLLFSIFNLLLFPKNWVMEHTHYVIAAKNLMDQC